MDSNNKSLKVVFCESLFWFGFIFLIGWPQKGNQKGNWTCNAIWEALVSLKSEKGSMPGGRPWVLQNAGDAGDSRQHALGEAAAEGRCEGGSAAFPPPSEFFIFGCAGSSLLLGLFSSCSPRAPLCGASLLWGTGSRLMGFRSCSSGVGSRGLSCSKACGIFPDQGSNPCSLRWQADYLPLSHQGSPSLPSFYNLSLA